MDTDVLVIGAGMAGLMAATVLDRQGIDVTVLEQGKQVGGRLATEDIGPGRADSGAQFFTVRSPEFANWVQQWEYEKIAYIWSMGFSHGSLHGKVERRHPRYAVAHGMRALPEHLANDLGNVQTGVQVMTVTSTGSEWLVQDHDGNVFISKALLMTPPIPLALQMLRSGGTPLTQHDQDELSLIEYAPCLCGLFWVDGVLHLPDPGVIQHDDSAISWIANNQQKGISPEATILTIHATPDYSRELWAAPDHEILAVLRESLKPYLEPDTKIREARLERWTHAMVTQHYDAPCLIAQDLPPLVFAGDGFQLSTVEGAALSGIAAGRVLYEMLTTA